MSKQIHVLHICESFDPGGVAWWLIDMTQRMKPSEFAFDFLCLGNTQGMRADEVTSLGCNIKLFQATPREVFLGTAVRQLLASNDYQIVHSHIFNLSGWLLRHACAYKVPVRVAHFHNTEDGRVNSIQAAIRRKLGRTLVSQNANVLLACSLPALDHAPEIENAIYTGVVHYGIDGTKYTTELPKLDLRAELHLDPDTKLIGHIGRFYPQKNHGGLIHIFASVAQLEARAHLVLVGSGPLERDTRELVRELGLADRVHFLGARNDVPQLLPNLDVFAFPSLHEGMGIVVLEARYAGVPVVASNLAAIAEAADSPEGVKLINYWDQSAFADSIAAYLAHPMKVPPSSVWKDKFSQAASATNLRHIYVQSLAN